MYFQSGQLGRLDSDVRESNSWTRVPLHTRLLKALGSTPAKQLLIRYTVCNKMAQVIVMESHVMLQFRLHSPRKIL